MPSVHRTSFGVRTDSGPTSNGINELWTVPFHISHVFSDWALLEPSRLSITRGPRTDQSTSSVILVLTRKRRRRSACPRHIDQILVSLKVSWKVSLHPHCLLCSNMRFPMVLVQQKGDRWWPCRICINPIIQGLKLPNVSTTIHMFKTLVPKTTTSTTSPTEASTWKDSHFVRGQVRGHDPINNFSYYVRINEPQIVC